MPKGILYERLDELRAIRAQMPAWLHRPTLDDPFSPSEADQMFEDAVARAFPMFRNSGTLNGFVEQLTVLFGIFIIPIILNIAAYYYIPQLPWYILIVWYVISAWIVYTILEKLLAGIVWYLIQIPLERHVLPEFGEKKRRELEAEIASCKAWLAEQAAKKAAEEARRLANIRHSQECQRLMEASQRAARLKKVEDSLFAAWRRFQGAVDFDGSMPKSEVKKLFQQKIHTLPIWSHEDRGLLAESQNPLIRDILGNVFYSLPAPPK